MVAYTSRIIMQAIPARVIEKSANIFLSLGRNADRSDRGSIFGDKLNYLNRTTSSFGVTLAEFLCQYISTWKQLGNTIAMKPET